MLDPYVYPGTETLKNIFDVRDSEELKKYESDYVASRIKDIYEKPLVSEFKFKDLCKMHHYIFQDIYDWAGQSRYIEIEKAESVLNGISVEYSKPYEIGKLSEMELDKMKSIKWDELTLDDKANKFSKSMAALWKVHPFREGNTRTVVTFFCKFAESKGIALDTFLFEKNATYLRSSLVAASAYFKDGNLGDKSKPEYLIRIIKDSMQRGLSQDDISASNLKINKESEKEFDR